MDENKQSRKIMWYSLAFMAFSAVWGFGNVVNGFSEFGGLKAIVSWILIFAIYFVPYTLMVGELGSSFKNLGGGVSSWIDETIGPKLAYYAGWTYWVVHLPYISQKPQGAIIAGCWTIFQNNTVSKLDPKLLQFLCLVIFLAGLWVASRGIKPLKQITTIAGTSMFVMSILFILLMVAAPAITHNSNLLNIDWSAKTFLPTFDLKYFTSLSILVFAVGGCEKISPYVNKMKDPERGFPKGMIALAIMVAVCAILGTISLGMMFDSNNVPKDLLTNGAYYAFQRLGEYYHLGNTFVVIYAITNVIGQISTLILSIDAPLRILLETTDKKYIPSKLFVKNKYGSFTNGNKLIGIIVCILIIIPAFGIGNVDSIVRWLVKLNAVCMPLRYLWVFVAYIALKRAGEKFSAEYRFTKSKTMGIIMGAWCFIFTAFACIGGMYSDNKFQLIMNIVTPFILVGLGIIMPKLAERERIAKEQL
ncbi:APC family permease [Clostridium fallax]|uniref:Amino acid/polyamine/organocation transporter, APC superfamily n=1 Tax=Clostridium fallax TaxID=1533 RepID=A0A1M4XFW1_9CLOT|nr:amino acid permease [Clostridium fallax]SHE92072.1 amino acid/polyamine/organocation transporter, APC superfamily [Clostridium fallax]SQB06428.1 amino acid permease family protein [Clostridium fallax]